MKKKQEIYDSLKNDEINNAYEKLKNYISLERLTEKDFEARFDNLFNKKKWTKLIDLYNRHSNIYPASELIKKDVILKELGELAFAEYTNILAAKTDQKKEQHLKKIEQYCTEAIKLNPNSEILKRNLSKVFNSLGYIEYNRALAAKTDQDKEQHFKEAEQYCTKAVVHYYKATESNPNDVMIKNSLGNIFNLLHNIEYNRALAAKTDQDKEQHFKEAEQYCTKAVQLNPNFAVFKRNVELIIQKRCGSNIYDNANNSMSTSQKNLSISSNQSNSNDSVEFSHENNIPTSLGLDILGAAMNTIIKKEKKAHDVLRCENNKRNNYNSNNTDMHADRVKRSRIEKNTQNTR